MEEGDKGYRGEIDKEGDGGEEGGSEEVGYELPYVFEEVARAWPRKPQKRKEVTLKSSQIPDTSFKAVVGQDTGFT